MRWLLLTVVMGVNAYLYGQSTLKIYVTNDDGRSDMAIIDLNTSALNNYGRSVDSTNVQFYTMTMNTQVIRMTYEELFGADEEDVIEGAEMASGSDLGTPVEGLAELDAPVASSTLVENIVESKPKSVAVALPQPILERSPQRSEPIIKAAPTRMRSISSGQRTKAKKYKSVKRTKPKKSKRAKKYKGQCPKFF